jgi:hypothetical protein
LLDARVQGSSHLIRATEQTDLSFDRYRPRIDGDGRRAGKLVRFGLARLVKLSALCDASRRSAGKGEQVIDVRNVGVRVSRALAARHSDAGALINAGDRVLDAVVVEDQLESLVTFPEELSPIASARESGPQRL